MTARSEVASRKCPTRTRTRAIRTPTRPINHPATVQAEAGCTSITRKAPAPGVPMRWENSKGERRPALSPEEAIGGARHFRALPCPAGAGGDEQDRYRAPPQLSSQPTAAQPECAPHHKPDRMQRDGMAPVAAVWYVCQAGPHPRGGRPRDGEMSAADSDGAPSGPFPRGRRTDSRWMAPIGTRTDGSSGDLGLVWLGVYYSFRAGFNACYLDRVAFEGRGSERH